MNAEKVTRRVQVGIALWRLFHAINETVFRSHDMDARHRDWALRLPTDFGINAKMSDRMPTRISFLAR